VSVPRGPGAGLEPTSRDAPTFGLERAARADEALGIRRGILCLREPKDGYAAERGNTEKMAAEDQP
jgi:hypothetical protein